MTLPVTGKVSGKPRNTGADVIKGAAILLVILGHGIQAHIQNFDDNLIFRIIYSFHMPLFMILSGWFAAPEKGLKLKTAVRLVVPVITWYFLPYLVEGEYRTTSLVRFVAQWIKAPDVGLWFLWVLFLCHLWLVTVKKWEMRLGLPAYLLGIGLLLLLPFSTLGLKMAKYYFPFVVAGYLACRYRERVARYSRVAIAISAAVFPVGFHYWHRTREVGLALPVFMVVHVACALTGSAIFIYLMMSLSKTPVGQGFAWLGRQTLEIYAIHQFVIPLALGQGIAAVVSSVAIATTVSLSGIFVVRKSRLASFILFGIKGDGGAPLPALRQDTAAIFPVPQWDR